ncbi:hypothetical protein IAQ61_000592 [Plenodomus lingam]|uniref:uncharacterized protein n=1 Tax=Leptosphaeria maculans TaxID=5022 RepID=UPI0033251B43|nr:hypothetical protein IAQ61_000592 [Plenodomus lingam]
MPALPLHHLAARYTTDQGAGGISATAIGLIVGVGLVPALILLWVICWLLFGYPFGRNMCCCVRKRKTDALQPMQMQRGSSDLSENPFNEKAGVTMPKKPYEVWARTESGSSSEGAGVLEQSGGRGGRLERQRDSGLSDMGVQEPKRFV